MKLGKHYDYLIENFVQSGKYDSPEDVVRAALTLLEASTPDAIQAQLLELLENSESE
ncbi:MAG: type II toxin-antitoxin system ParD family antitoxin [Gammaproteobacteria bacterium]|nr:type II toxin-antitoxin system ParD family antitoxin [Gammaproteobacteria bacterium]